MKIKLRSIYIAAAICTLVGAAGCSFPGRTSEADKALKLHPTKMNTYGGAHIQKGIAYEELKKNADAISSYKAAAKDRDFKDLAEWYIEKIIKDK